VSGDRIDFHLVASGSRQRHDGGAAQIMKRQPANSRSRGRLAPRALETAFAPRLAVAVDQRIERSFQFVGDRDGDISACAVESPARPSGAALCPSAGRIWFHQRAAARVLRAVLPHGPSAAGSGSLAMFVAIRRALTV
jgi:hypothetical protein